MNKTIRRMMILALALMMCFAMIPTAGAIHASTTGGATAAMIDVNLIMDRGAPIPQPTFAYTLTADAVTNPAFPLFNGILTGVKIGKQNALQNATTYSLAFTQTSATAGLPSDATGTTTDGKQYVTEQLSIDFSGVTTFTEPGVYRYVLTETQPDSPFALYTGETGIRYIDVYVEYANDAATDLTIQGIVTSTANNVTAGDPNGGTNTADIQSKDTKINNEYTTYDLTLQKFVSGNQASQNQHFDFSVTVTNPATPAGTAYPNSYTVTKTCLDNNVTNPATITAGASATFHLKTGESIVISNLPAGATYTIVETSSGYVTTAKVGGAAHTDDDTNDDTFTVKDTTGINADTTVVFTNARSGIIPTGVLLTIAPFAVLMIVGLIGVLVIMRKRHNK